MYGDSTPLGEDSGDPESFPQTSSDPAKETVFRGCIQSVESPHSRRQNSATLRARRCARGIVVNAIRMHVRAATWSLEAAGAAVDAHE